MGIPLIRIRCYPQYRWMGVTRDNGTKKKDRKRLRHHSSYHPKIMLNVTGKVTYQKKKKKCIGALQTQSYPPRTHRLPLLRTPMVAVHLLLGFRGAPSGRREGGFDSWRGVRLDLEGTDNFFSFSDMQPLPWHFLNKQFWTGPAVVSKDWGRDSAQRSPETLTYLTTVTLH